MMHRFDDGRTALSVLLENSTTPSWMVRADGADFGVKDALKARGYRWDPDRSVWGREVTDADRLAEEDWLAGHVYASAARPRAAAPTITRITNRTRHAAPPAADGRMTSGEPWTC